MRSHDPQLEEVKGIAKLVAEIKENLGCDLIECPECPFRNPTSQNSCIADLVISNLAETEPPTWDDRIYVVYKDKSFRGGVYSGVQPAVDIISDPMNDLLISQIAEGDLEQVLDLEVNEDYIIESFTWKGEKIPGKLAILRVQ